MPADTDSRFAYRAFGLILVSDEPVDSLAGVEVDAGVRGDLVLRRAPDRVARIARAAPGVESVDVVHGPDGDLRLRVSRANDADLLRFPGIADFALADDLVLWRAAPGAARIDIETLVLSAVVGYWLERRGRPILHASGVVIEGRAWLFVARSGGGKSGLAAWLARDGCPLIGDDVVALEATGAGWLAHPSFPVVRMWPDMAEALGVESGESVSGRGRRPKRLVRVGAGGFGRFAASAAPLASIVVAARSRESTSAVPVRLARLPPAEAFAELIRHSYVARLAGAVGLDRLRFDRIADLAGAASIYRLDYQDGFDRLQSAVEAVRAEAAASRVTGAASGSG